MVCWGPELCQKPEHRKGFLVPGKPFWEGFVASRPQLCFLGVCSPSASETTGYQAYDACSGNYETDYRQEPAELRETSGCVVCALLCFRAVDLASDLARDLDSNGQRQTQDNKRDGSGLYHAEGLSFSGASDVVDGGLPSELQCLNVPGGRFLQVHFCYSSPPLCLSRAFGILSGQLWERDKAEFTLFI